MCIRDRRKLHIPVDIRRRVHIIKLRMESWKLETMYLCSSTEPKTFSRRAWNETVLFRVHRIQEYLIKWMKQANRRVPMVLEAQIAKIKELLERGIRPKPYEPGSLELIARGTAAARDMTAVKALERIRETYLEAS